MNNRTVTTIFVAVILLATTALAWSVHLCTDTGCVNCTNALPAATFISGSCAIISGESFKVECDGSRENMTVEGFATPDCTAGAVETRAYKVGCHPDSSSGYTTKVSCSAHGVFVVGSSVVVAVVATVLFAL